MRLRVIFERRCRLAVGLGSASAAFGVGEAIALAIHLEDMDVMGQPVEQRAGQALGTKHAAARS